MAKQNVYLASKPRYDILDGLRGVAAVMVVLFHFCETYAVRGVEQHINHGYLAVDFFFVLSGFVVGYAYNDRWDKMTTWGFFKRRLTRLHPMVLAGATVGLALFFQGAGYFPQVLQNPAWKVALCFVMGLFMIPCGPKMDIRGWGELNSFNGPQWTLTFEYIANILYAFILRRLPTFVLVILCAASAFCTLDLTLGWNVFGLLHYPQYTVIGGWSTTPDQVYIGFTRLLYPFLCGLIMSRLLAARSNESNPSGSPISIKNGFFIAALIIVIVLAFPCIGGHKGVADGIYQAVCILAVFPFVVLLGAGSNLKTSWGQKICKWLGDLSYPLYITHYPLIYLQMSFVAEHKDAPMWIHVLMTAGIFFTAIIIARGLLKIWDEPVRAWLTEHWLKGDKSRK